MGDEKQYAYMQSLWAPVEEVQAVFCDAPSGTGKTTLAVLAGAYEVEIGTYECLIYVRNAVPVRDLGFLPGDIADKERPYMQPLIDAMEYVHPAAYDRWVQAGRIKAITSAFARGITWRRSYIVVDEAQNFTLEELQAVLTRIADDCKVVVIGSTRQIDNHKLRRIAGLTPFELYMQHFAGDSRVAVHTLETCYRGWFAEWGGSD